MSESEKNATKYFLFNLNQTSTVILFVLALRTVIGLLSTINGYIFDLFWIFYRPQIDEIISSLIGLVLTLILLAFLCYTIFICLKMRRNDINNEDNTVNWFGFKINDTSASILFLISLIGLINLFTVTINTIYNLITFLNNPFSIYRMTLKPFLLFCILLIQSIFLAPIYLYTIQKCISLLKKPKSRIQVSLIRNSKNAKLLGFDLNEISGSIIFILSVIGIITYSSQLIGYIFNSIFNRIPTQNTIYEVLDLILILIFLGFFFHFLDSCFNLKKSQLNRGIQEVKWFGFKMDKTSVIILFVMAVLGLIHSLKTLIEFISVFINSLIYFDFFIRNIGTLIIYLVIIIEEIIYLVIYGYTITKCVKVKKLEG